ncbi:MAG: hypothetical protein V1736_11555 [Pseudomonadota bacterium]
MSNPVLKSICIALVISIVFAAVPASAGRCMARDTSAEAIVIDALVLRPVGVVLTIAGVALFVVALPFSIPSSSVGKTARKLVVDPAKYTFTRPLGDPKTESD